MRIYIASPYSAGTPEERLANTQKAMHHAILLIHRGHHPYCPHLSHFLDGMATGKGMSIHYEQWMALDLDYLAACDALLYLGDSPGTRRELDLAQQLEMPVYYSLDEVPRGNDEFVL